MQAAADHLRDSAQSQIYRDFHQSGPKLEGTAGRALRHCDATYGGAVVGVGDGRVSWWGRSKGEVPQ